MWQHQHTVIDLLNVDIHTSNSVHAQPFHHCLKGFENDQTKQIYFSILSSQDILLFFIAMRTKLNSGYIYNS